MSTRAKAPDVFNPFLAGNYAPVAEEITANCAEVIGTIPADLNGHFLRIGPNPVFIPDPATYHLFDGDGMIHAVRFDGGRAQYRNRFVDTEGLRKERAKGTWIWKGMAGIGDMVKGIAPPPEGPIKNTANTAMVHHSGTLYALMEAAPPHIVSLPGLETLGEYRFGGKLRHPFTAHPKVDAVTGEMMTFGYSPVPPYVTYSVIDAAGEIVHTAPITLPKGVMMHDCAITEHYTVFLDMPVTFDFARAMQGGMMLDWEPGNGSRIGVLPRRGTNADIRWFEVATGMVFHVSNAWEEGDEVVVQASRSRRTDVMRMAETAAGDLADQIGQLHEWRLNLKTGVVTERTLASDYHCDFTRIDDRLCGRRTRYTYAARFDFIARVQFDALVKYDDVTGRTQVHGFGDGRFGGEGVFAPRDGATAEDDGYVIVFVQDETAGRSECLVIDARDFDAPPVARIVIPARVPYGFHAAWVPAG